jgi:hypothetical protein
MKEHILHIQLAETPSLRHNNREHKSNCGEFDNRAKSVIIINPIALLESPGNQCGLISVNRLIHLSLDFEDPLAIN